MPSTKVKYLPSHALSPVGDGVSCEPAPRDDCRECDWECLVRPRFFCGQMLTDGDMNALLDWSGQRFELQRHKTGWGLVGGLELHCDADCASRLIMEPGYAVDCCGRDILNCAP